MVVAKFQWVQYEVTFGGKVSAEKPVCTCLNMSLDITGICAHWHLPRYFLLVSGQIFCRSLVSYLSELGIVKFSYCSLSYPYAWGDLGQLLVPCWTTWGLPTSFIGPVVWTFPTLKSHCHSSALTPQRRSWGVCLQ